MEVIGPFISLLSLLIAGLVAYVLATVENRLTRKFDDRYVLNKEMLAQLADQEHWREDLNRRMDELLEASRKHEITDEKMREQLLAESGINRRETAEAIRQLRDELKAR